MSKKEKVDCDCCDGHGYHIDEDWFQESCKNCLGTGKMYKEVKDVRLDSK